MVQITTTQGHLIRKAGMEMSADTIASRFAIPLRTVKTVLRGDVPPGGYYVPKVVDDRFEEEGRPDIRRHLIARKSALALTSWGDDPAILRAQAQYDAGEIDMAQGRSATYIFLYAFPRKEKDVTRQAYFSKVNHE